MQLQRISNSENANEKAGKKASVCVTTYGDHDSRTTIRLTEIR